jgi:Beta-lactamase enzyme family/ORF 12 gene product N-terminal
MSELRARRSNRRGRPARPFLAALTIAVALLAAACTSPKAQAPGGLPTAAGSPQPARSAVPPDTPAGAQLRWLIAAAAHLPLSDAQIRAHFDPAFLAQVSPAALNEALQQEAIRIRLLSVRVSELSTLVADVSAYDGNSRAEVLLTVDSQGLVSWLRISPASTGPTPASWADVDATLRSVAPQVHLLVADVSNGSCQLIHSIAPGTPAPLGSAVKLYVLDALGNAVAARKVRWDQPLTVTAQFKGLPPGELQIEPDGTQISVLDSAAKMISLSDNTAADMLTGLVGRSGVEAALTATGMTSPALDRPFLTTREIFVLKLEQWPALAQRYVTADEPSRRALLASTVDRVPLPAVEETGAWTTPRDIDRLEYFASASDLCRAYTSLAALAHQPGLAPIGQVLSLNDDGLQLDPAQWETTWFKGGSEPGVLTLAFLATTRSGHSYVVTVLAENTSQPIDQATAIPAVLSAVKGAFTLAARG